MRSVDLRSGIDSVYNQSATNACGPHAVVNALDAMYDHAGRSKRFSRSHLWWWARFWGGMVGQNVGTTIATLCKSVAWNGMMTEAECPWDYPPAVMPSKGEMGYKLATSSFAEGLIPGVKRLLCLGVPVVWCMKVTPGLYALQSQRDWRRHDLSSDLSGMNGNHWVCIVGYDDDAGRLLIENSWGPDWGDGGFFGLPYASMQPLNEGWCHVDRAPIHPKPVEGYTVTAPRSLLSLESAAYVDRSRQALTETLMAAFAQGGAVGLVDACNKWGVSDKHLEMLAGWPRGAVRQYQIENPAPAWDAFNWDQI